MRGSAATARPPPKRLREEDDPDRNRAECADPAPLPFPSGSSGPDLRQAHAEISGCVRRASLYDPGMTTKLRLGKRIAPVRFLFFAAILLIGLPVLAPTIGWRHGIMASFDAAAAIFLVSLWPLLKTSRAELIRGQAAKNDANRALLLAVSGIVMLAILLAVGSELVEKGSPKPGAVALIVGTLALSWLFSNMVYALHYAHIFYSQDDLDGDGTKEDLRGLEFPKTKEPNYWDFIYYSFTLGMTFQTSDVDTTTTSIRIVTIFHCLAAFVFNIGVLAFTINVLGGG